MVLFANYKTFSVAVDDKGKKHKAQGRSRVMYTTHHPCWDAKNRYGLAEELSFDYINIAHIMDAPVKQKAGHDNPSPLPEQSLPKEEAGKPDVNEKIQPEVPEKEQPNETVDKETLFMDSNPEHIPQALKELMQDKGVNEWDIQNVVAAKGYYPSNTPIEKYDDGFIHGVLIAAWPKVYEMIQMAREKEEIPFN